MPILGEGVEEAVSFVQMAAFLRLLTNTLNSSFTHFLFFR